MSDPHRDNDNDNDHSFSQLSVHEALTCPEGQSAWSLAPSLFGENTFAPCRNTSSRYSCSRATWNEVGLYLCWKGKCGLLRVVAVFVGLFAVVASLRRITHRLFQRGMSSVSVVVVGIGRVRCLFLCCWLGCLCRGRGDGGVLGRVVCLSLRCFQSRFSTESHFEPSCAVVSQVVSFVRSLLFLKTPWFAVGVCVDVVYHLLAGLSGFRYLFLLV